MFEVHHQLQTYCQYCRVFKGNTERSADTARREIGAFLKFTDIQHVQQITRPQLETYLMYGKLERQWGAKTIRNRIIAVRLFLDWCQQQGWIDDNPARGLPMPKLPKRLPRHLPKDDALKLLEWTRYYRYPYHFERSRAVAIMALFMFTGLRLRELQNLSRDDINIDERRVFVRSGKGDKDRPVPMNHDLAVCLQDYLDDRDRRKRHCPSFFVSLKKDKPMGPQAVPRLVKKLREASGIYFCPHMLRHTFATLMLEGGADIFAISKMMGHSDIKTTTIYLSATTKHLEAEVAKHPLGKSPTQPYNSGAFSNGYMS